MKLLALATVLMSFSLPAAARCVVEIISAEGEPLGYVFQETTCTPAMQKCRTRLARLTNPGATCEITLDIPGELTGYEGY